MEKTDKIYIRLKRIRIPEIALSNPGAPVGFRFLLELRISRLQSHSAREESAIRKIATDYSPFGRRGDRSATGGIRCGELAERAKAGKPR